MKFDDVDYGVLCNVIKKIGPIYALGFAPWAVFVKTDNVKLVESERFGGWSSPAPLAKEISTYQDCVDVEIFESGGKIMIGLFEYPGNSLDGTRNGPIKRRYLFEVLRVGQCLTDAVNKEFAFFVRKLADAEELARKMQIRGRVEKNLLAELGIC